MRLMLFTACEKVIQDPNSGTSLIDLFQEIGVAVPSAAEVPIDAVIPKDWAAFALWALDEAEIGSPFAMKIQIFWPDGKLFLENRVPQAEITKKPYLSFTVRMTVLPMGQSGKMKIKVWLVEGETAVTEPNETDVMVRLIHDDNMVQARGGAL